MAKIKNFLVSVADAALFYKDILVATATANISSSIEVSMSDQEVTGGKGSMLQYSFKYGRRFNVTLEAADFKLEYVALQTGSKISESLSEVYHIAECVNIVDSIGTLKDVPIGAVAVEIGNNNIITVEPNKKTIDLTKYGITEGAVNATYKYNNITKSIKVDADSTPFVTKLVLDADRHNQKIGKIGSLQIVVPSYQLSGNFTLNMSSEGASSVSMEGTALAVDSDTCSDGSNVYAYIHEFDDTNSKMVINEIAVSPANISLTAGDTTTISVIGLKGELYSNIELDNETCSFVSADVTKVTVDDKGVVSVVNGASADTVEITVKYGELSDTATVTIV